MVRAALVWVMLPSAGSLAVAALGFAAGFGPAVATALAGAVMLATSAMGCRATLAAMTVEQRARLAQPPDMTDTLLDLFPCWPVFQVMRRLYLYLVCLVCPAFALVMVSGSHEIPASDAALWALLLFFMACVAQVSATALFVAAYSDAKAMWKAMRSKKTARAA